MPDRTTTTSKINPPPKGTVNVGANGSPCGNPNRAVTDIAGRLNDLINCYLLTAGEYLKVYLPLAILAVLLMAILLFTAYQFLKE